MTMLKTIKKTLKATLVGTVCVLALAGAAVAETRTFDVPAGSLKAGLESYIKQSGIQLIYRSDDVKGRTTKGVHGALSPEEALNQLLGAGFTVTRDAGGAVIISKVRQVQSPSDGPVAEAEPTEVVVTGSHIRNANPTSPLHTVSRNDIDQSGYSQIGDVMRSLPENFGGGQNPGVFAAYTGNSGNYNISNGSTVNLRGLGSDATLVLVNGHRLSADSYFQGSDISGVPLAAVQRIEVVTDGASALYGSDAVAGVANIILRKNYDGGEVSARVGSASQGGGNETTISAMSGIAKGSWYGLINLEYSKQDAITADQRKITAGATPDTMLIQPQSRNSLFVTAGGKIRDYLSVSFDGLVGDRDTQSVTHYSSSSPVYNIAVYSPSYNLAFGADVDLPQDWKLHVSEVVSGSRNSTTSRSTAGDSNSLYTNSLNYGEVTANGTLTQLPTGPLKIAVGGGYRQEQFQQNWRGSTSYINVSRKVNYLYAEALVPLVRTSASRTGLHELEVSLSARSEDYSDFGKTTTPKIGVRYVPLNDLTIRGTWGKSFKAPSFYQMYSATNLYLYKASLFSYSGGGTVLRVEGGNPDLKPEKSTSWTFGADYRPTMLRSMKLSATYFNVDYTSRVIQPITNIRAALTDPIYAPFVDYSPSSDYLADLIAGSFSFTNLASTNYAPSGVVAVVRNSYQNATSQTAKGVDVSYRQSFNAGSGSVDMFANATWLKLRQNTLPATPVQDISGTIFNAPDFKARAGATWRLGGLAASGIVNFVSEETDTGITPNAKIGSWTTVDASLSYSFPHTRAWTDGLRISLSGSNLFDRLPPRAPSVSLTFGGVNYDSTNSSIVGRFVSLTVAKGW